MDQENFDQLAEDGIQFLIHVMGDNAERLLRPATLYAAGLSENYWTTAILVGVEATMPEFGISNERTVVITEDAAVGGETGVIQVYGNLVLEEGVTLRTGWLTVHDGEIYLAEGADLDVAEDIDGTVTGPGADDDDDDDDHSGGGLEGGKVLGPLLQLRQPDGDGAQPRRLHHHDHHQPLHRHGDRDHPLPRRLPRGGGDPDRRHGHHDHH